MIVRMTLLVLALGFLGSTVLDTGTPTQEQLASIVGGGLIPQGQGGEEPGEEQKEKCVQSTPARTCTSEWNGNINCGENQWCSATNQTGDIECPKGDCDNNDKMKECKTGESECTVIPASDTDCGDASPGKCHYSCYQNPDECPEDMPWSCAATDCTGGSGGQLPCPGVSSCR